MGRIHPTVETAGILRPCPHCPKGLWLALFTKKAGESPQALAVGVRQCVQFCSGEVYLMVSHASLMITGPWGTWKAYRLQPGNGHHKKR